MTKHLARLRERFWSKVSVKEDSKCWPWNACKDVLGYGKFQIKELRIQSAHRAAFFFRHERLPFHACHTCDNPSCCNPKHIYNGSPKTNANDRKVRNRNGAQMMGENHPRSKLNDTQVKSIRERYRTGKYSMAKLAALNNITFSTVQRIIQRKTWWHI